ncbi:glycoside hydrolase family 3 N-terminal domain-containing protein [Micromonospora robiginosa]|uniref:beta-glucosidase n=1 Tax=Micromonospora robiginosa TaxID=2749844 RepID=A0A7L6B4K0_9ACTN|nr:glycoside hydrolase family 3 N-terminal domain-containing protein [Micromonospora ferruginea]QLQ36725.2 glycoside hydrolase family 3 N-terminal domain-containing protein [Micromonospora ferruginea]
MATTVALAATGLTLAPVAAAQTLPYQDSSLPASQRVADLLSRMSLDEKIGQMTQAERAKVSPTDVTARRLGSVLSGGGSAPSPNTPAGWADMYDAFQRGALATPLGIPMLYGSDAVHGHNNVVGSTIFPHNIGLGATRDPGLAERIGRATAEEVTGTGVDWTFSPCLCVARNDRWGRTYESFGEKPELATQMSSIVTGYQGTTLGGPASVLATAKHYVGDGGTTNGTDQGNAQLSEAELRAIHLPPFVEAIRRGVGSIMVSYSSWNGQKLHGNRYLITDLLKNELGFTGFVVSDWNGIDQIDGAPGFTGAEVAQAVNAGIDMVMAPDAWQSFITLLRAEVQAGRVPMSRIDDANRRILTKKFELGLFERPLADRSYAGTLGNAAHRELAREAVAESQVLLKNGGALPLRTNSRIFVAGRNADNIGNQSGGWTVSWQGGSGNTTPGTTVLQGIRNTVGSAGTVTYSLNGSGIDSSYDVAVAVVGETPYAEGQGDRPTGMGLDTTDLNTINTLRAAGVPVVVVLVSGRPLDIAAQVPNWNSLVAAWLPGTEGQGVADVLFAVRRPTGKLPVTWMQSVSQQPINDGDGKAPLFPYGFGLSYGNPAPDTTPPTAPTNLRATVSGTSATLTWSPSTDDVGVREYIVHETTGTSDTVYGRTTTPSVTISGLVPGASRQFFVVAADAAGNTSPASTTVVVQAAGVDPTPTPTPTPTQGAAACQVTYATNDWDGGFSATITVRNTGTAALSGWTLRFAFPDAGQRVTQGWSATWSQSGTAVTAGNAAWNGSLPAGASTGLGFNGTYGGTNPRPTSFTLNGAPCTAG